jgi:hypothetical protein
MKRLLLSTVALLALTGAASADILGFTTTGSTSELSLTQVQPGGNQPTNNPCLICGTNQPAQPAGFGYNNFDATGNVSSYTMFSSATVGASLASGVEGTGYQVGDGSILRAFLLAQASGTTFNVGIDLNQTGANAQTLEAFYFLNLTDHTILAQMTTPTVVGTLANGTGFPDWTLSGFDINRGDIGVGDTVIFLAKWSNANDGAESFFLVPSVQAVPGPLVGAGLPGLIAACMGLFGFHHFRRKRALA